MDQGTNMWPATSAPEWAVRALSGVYDPCCREKGISIVDMGLLRSVEVVDGHARVERFVEHEHA